MIIKTFGILLMTSLLFSCNSTTQNQTEDHNKTDSPKGSYGELIDKENALPASEIKYILAENDSVAVKLSGEIATCCQHSGCWMDIKVDEETLIKVTFADYNMTIPTDSKGKKTYIKGYAKKELIPVETLQNYAREEGQSKEEVAMITKPEIAYTFEATGVLILE